MQAERRLMARVRVASGTGIFAMRRSLERRVRPGALWQRGPRHKEQLLRERATELAASGRVAHVHQPRLRSVRADDEAGLAWNRRGVGTYDSTGIAGVVGHALRADREFQDEDEEPARHKAFVRECLTDAS